MSGELKEADKNSAGSQDDPDSLYMMLAETKRKNQERETHADPSSGTYNLNSDDATGGEELEMIAVTRKPFRQLSSNSNIRMNLEPESNREVFFKIKCVKIRDDIHKPGEKTGKLRH